MKRAVLAGRLRRVACVLAALSCFLGFSVARVQAAPPTPKAVLILFEGIGYNDLSTTSVPALRALRDEGSVALMLGSTDYDPGDVTSYLEIGMGRPIRGDITSRDGVTAFDAGEDIPRGTGRDAYGRTVGAPSAGFAVLAPDVVGVRSALQANGNPANVGVLAGALGEAGVKVRVIGASDRPVGDVTIDRPAVLAAMDSEGRVAEGRVSELVRRDVAFPFGWRTDYDRLLEEVSAAGADEVLIIDTGDGRRANAEALHGTAEANAMTRERALAAAAPLLELAEDWASEGTLVVIASVSAPMDELVEGRTLAPVLVAGGDIARGGLLTSATTRNPGLVAPWDIAPTIVAHAGGRGAFVGNVLQSSATSGAGRDAALRDLAHDSALLRQSRSTVLAVFSAIQMLCMIALAVPFVHVWVTEKRSRWWLPSVLIVLPLGLHLQALLGPLAAAPALAVAGVLAGAIVVLAVTLFRDARRSLMALSVLSAVALLVDLAWGAPVMRWSYLGYDVSAGGRFYGIGNEYAGVLLGASLLTVTLASALFPRNRLTFWVSAASLAAIVGVLALPQLGADAGGALASAIAYGITLWGLSGRRLSPGRTVLLLVGFGVLALIGLVVLNAQGGSASHVGRFFGDALSGGLASAFGLLRRKVNANITLFSYTQWGHLVWAYLALIAWLWRRQRREIASGIEQCHALRSGVVGMAVGALALFALNDSGTVALVLMAPFVVALVLVIAATGRSTFADASLAESSGP